MGIDELDKRKVEEQSSDVVSEHDESGGGLSRCWHCLDKGDESGDEMMTMK